MITSKGIPKTWIFLFGSIAILFLCYHLFLPKPHNTLSSYSAERSTNDKLEWLDSPVQIIGMDELENLNQKDSRLINYIKARHLYPPSKLQYNFNGTFSKEPNFDRDVTDALQKIFKSQTNGYFVECGAFDGIYSSTLFLERGYGWSGLLIECNPVLIPELQKVHRKAYVADVCISVTEYPSMIEITSMEKAPASSSVGKGDIFPNIASNFTRFEVPSFPIYSIIAATGANVVDLITLDVQSIEWKVLKNFPFESILVKVWNIEIAMLSDDDVKKLKSLMKLNGYRNPLAIGDQYDYLFVHSSMPLDSSIPLMPD